MKHILVLLRDSSRKSKKPSHNLTFWLAFSVFDPRKLPENLEVEDSYGEEEIHKLISWYGIQKSDTYEGKTTFQKDDLEADHFEQNGQDSSIWCMNDVLRIKKNIDIKIIRKKSKEGKESLRLSKSQ